MSSGCQGIIINNQFGSLMVTSPSQGQCNIVGSMFSLKHQSRELWPRPDTNRLLIERCLDNEVKRQWSTRALERPHRDFNLVPPILSSHSIFQPNVCDSSPVQSSRVVRLLNLPLRSFLSTLLISSLCTLPSLSLLPFFLSLSSPLSFVLSMWVFVWSELFPI